MASACVNNISVSPETFLDCPAPRSSFSWLTPRISKPDPESSPPKDAGDFEFRLDDQPVIMLPADELFSDGKLMPLQLKPPANPVSNEATSPDTYPAKSSSSCRKLSFSNDPYLFSPKAPRCSSRWRELLGFKKLSQKPKMETPTSSTTSTKSVRLFLYKNNSKTTSSSTSDRDDNNLSLPLLNNNHRLSLSSSDNHNNTLLPLPLPRLSVDSPNPPRLRTGRRPTRPDPTRMARGVSVDSPRMNASGRVLFQSSGLERSSSSPSSFNGGRPNRYRGMEQRSYSANVVRVTPVLNVPVCSSLRGSTFGFGQLFSSSSSSHSSANHSQSSSQKRESGGSNGNGRSHVQQQPSSCSRSKNKESM